MLRWTTRPRTILRDASVGLAIAILFTVFYIALAMRGTLEPSVAGSVIVVYCRSALPFTPAPAGQGSKGGLERWSGMFSEIHNVMGAVRFGLAHKAVGVRPHFLSPAYRDREGESWWGYHFAPVIPLPGYTADAPEVHFNGWIARFGRFGGFGRYIFGSGRTLRRFPAQAAVSRAEGHRLWTLLGVRRHVLDIVDAFERDHLHGCTLRVGVHYRGTDSKFHFPYKNLPYSTMLDHLRRTLADRRVPATGPGLCVFVATDEADFVDFMKASEFGKAVVVYDGSPRVAASSGNALHFTAMGMPNSKKGESAVVDCVILSRMHHLIKTRSAVSDTATLANPALNYTLVLGEENVFDVHGESKLVPYKP